MKLSKHISRKGFTLVELLIVIGILGILAVGLLAAVDPLEQIRKGQDTSKRALATEYQNAISRYFTTFGKMPWEATIPPGQAPSEEKLSARAADTQELTNKGELKSSFTSAAGTANLDLIYVTYAAASGELTVCFAPQSKSIRAEETTKYDKKGNLQVGCPNTSGNCYYCAR